MCLDWSDGFETHRLDCSDSLIGKLESGERNPFRRRGGRFCRHGVVLEMVIAKAMTLSNNKYKFGGPGDRLLRAMKRQPRQKIGMYSSACAFGVSIVFSLSF